MIVVTAVVAILALGSAPGEAWSGELPSAADTLRGRREDLSGAPVAKTTSDASGAFHFAPTWAAPGALGLRWEF